MFSFPILNKNVLLLIPCCRCKNSIGNYVWHNQGINDIQRLREELLQYVKNTPSLSNRLSNQRGILNPNGVLTKAVDLYDGSFYKTVRNYLRQIVMKNQNFGIYILIVSAFYGLARLDEGLKEYDLEMKDKIYNGLKVYQFWQQKQLWRILQNYIQQNNIEFVWSLLPDSQQFPYNQVFNNLWRQLRNSQVKCFHVRVPGVGSGTGVKRAEWLVEILKTNPNYLITNPFPPNKFENITKCLFEYKLLNI